MNFLTFSMRGSSQYAIFFLGSYTVDTKCVIPLNCDKYQIHSSKVLIEPTSTPDTSTVCSSRPTTVVPTIKAGEGNNSKSDDEPKIIIGVCVSVLGLILLLVAVGIVTKIYKEKYKNAFTLHEF